MAYNYKERRSGPAIWERGRGECVGGLSARNQQVACYRTPHGEDLDLLAPDLRTQGGTGWCLHFSTQRSAPSPPHTHTFFFFFFSCYVWDFLQSSSLPLWHFKRPLHDSHVSHGHSWPAFGDEQNSTINHTSVSNIRSI